MSRNHKYKYARYSQMRILHSMLDCLEGALCTGAWWICDAHNLWFAPKDGTAVKGFRSSFRRDLHSVWRHLCKKVSMSLLHACAES